jgi:hypothetical protein
MMITIILMVITMMEMMLLVGCVFVPIQPWLVPVRQAVRALMHTNCICLVFMNLHSKCITSIIVIIFLPNIILSE